MVRVTLLACFFALFSGAQALACGPHFQMFVVEGAEPSPTGAVNDYRCIRFLDDGANTEMIWYGQGDHSGAIYRHLGWYRRTGDRQEWVSADFFGNGEAFNGTSRINDAAVTFGRRCRGINCRRNNDINRITVTRPWKTTWVRVEHPGRDWSMQIPSWDITSCGPNFSSFSVRRAAGSPAMGIRCVLDTPDMAVWYGQGNWGGGPDNTYEHVGWNAGPGAGRGMHAFDICKAYLTSSREWLGPCGAFPNNAVQFTGGSTASGFLQVGGAWNEVWTRD